MMNEELPPLTPQRGEYWRVWKNSIAPLTPHWGEREEVYYLFIYCEGRPEHT